MHRLRPARAVSVALFVLLAGPWVALVQAATPTTTTLDISPNPVVGGDEVTFTATVTPTPPSGAVLFHNVTIGVDYARELIDGVATLTLRSGVSHSDNLYEGSYDFTAETFDLPAEYTDSTSETVAVEIVRTPASLEIGLGNSPFDVRSTPYTVFDSPSIWVTDDISPCTGSMELRRWVDDHWEFATSSGNITQRSDGIHSWCGAVFVLQQQPLGEQLLNAFWQGDDSHSFDEAEVDLEIVKGPVTAVAGSSLATVEVGFPVTLTGAAANSNAPGQGTMSFYDGSTLLGTVPYPNSGPATLTTSSLALGVHQIHVEYSGTVNLDAAVSANHPVTVSSNVVHAGGVGVSATSFYPVVDGYHDTVAIRGNREEAASVAIRIANSSNTTVRSLSVALGSGQYSLNWNGKSTSGKYVPSGTYKVIQTLKDAAGATRTFTSSVTVSLKRLVYTTVTLSKYADQATVGGKGGTGSIVKSTKYSRGLRLRSAAASWAGVGFQFTLPSATAYKSITIGALGSGSLPTSISAHDYRLGNWGSTDPWIIEYFSPKKRLSSSYVWTTQGVSATYQRKSRTVQVLIYAGATSPAKLYDLAKVKVTVTYGVLR